MKVILLNYTKNPLKTIYTAARTCYSAEKPSEIFLSDVPQEKIYSLLDRVIAAGHHSVLEHISFTFSIEGISRACSHQLVRHRIASFSQQSQRYVRADSAGFVEPDTIFADEFAHELFQKFVQDAKNAYREFISMGIPAEDARFALPAGIETNILMTMNFRELMNTSQIRLCACSQWEIRKLFERIRQEVISVDEMRGLGKYIAPKCEHLGYCPETKSCGRMPSRKEVFGE